jgi:hypothetical protein
MKVGEIINLLKLLILASEQIASVIENASIPEQDQCAVSNRVDSIMSNLKTAKSKIEVEPDVDSN